MRFNLITVGTEIDHVTDIKTDTFPWTKDYEKYAIEDNHMFVQKRNTVILFEFNEKTGNYMATAIFSSVRKHED